MKLQFFNRVTNYFKIGMLIVAMVFAVSCSNKDEDEPKNTNVSIVGTWQLSGVDKVEEYGFYRIITATFTNNGTLYSSTYYYPDDETTEISGTYKINGNKIVFTYDDGSDDDICFFETGKDSQGDYLIIYDYEEEKEEILLNSKYRRI